MQNTLENEVSTRAAIVLDQVDAVKSYVRSTLRPKMFETVPDKFILEAMSSSFISRRVMERIGDENQDYVYRRTAINAKNSAFEANAVERDLIQYFRNNRNEQLWQGLRNINGEKIFMLARPVKFTADCLVCHGNPDDAPVELTELYGSNGYNHSEDSIDGIVLVGIATSQYAAKTDRKFAIYVAVYIIISTFVLFLIYLTFQKIVVVNFRTLSSNFHKNFRDKKSIEYLQKVEGGDEIEDMIEGMEGLSQHLYEAEMKLKSYTADLEREVTKRTYQLSQENERRQKDFALFVDLLRALTKSQNRAGLWREALPLLSNRLNLVRASFICTFSSNQSFTWPEMGKEPTLPDDHISLLVEPSVRLIENSAFIPVGSSDDNIEGLLYLVRKKSDNFSADEQETLTAVGKQLGIAAENLAALDALLRETNNLQAIFEGITDPLILMENSGAVIMANHGANELLKTLQEQDPTFLDSLLDINGELSESGVESRDITLDNDRSFIVSTFPLPIDESQVKRLVVAIQEDTDKKKMLQQVVQSEKMATVGKLSAGLAHELNNPLGVILCYAELIKKALQENDLKSDIDVVIKHTKQAQTVLMDLLNFARPKISMDRLTVIGEVAESVCSIFQVQAKKKDVKLSCRRADLNKVSRVEPQVVEHIIVNLLINALDATGPKDGEIVVSTEFDQSNRDIILHVEDNGTGIPQNILPLIFDPFFTTKDVNQGTGLGLAMIYGNMRELGGSIEVKNKNTGGTVFTLKFPAADNNGN